MAIAPSNNEMKLTKPAKARMPRSSQLISVFGGRQQVGQHPIDAWHGVTEHRPTTGLGAWLRI